MIKPDERALRQLLRNVRPRPTDEHPFVDQLAEAIGMPLKRAYYILEKWSKRGEWGCGVSIRGGWFTEKGLSDESH